MFATYENHSWRVVEVTVTGADGAYQVSLPSDLTDDAYRLRVAPSAAAARRLADSVLERIDDPSPVTVEVVLWGVTLDDADGFRLGYQELERAEASR